MWLLDIIKMALAFILSIIVIICFIRLSSLLWEKLGLPRVLEAITKLFNVIKHKQ